MKYLFLTLGVSYLPALFNERWVKQLASYRAKMLNTTPSGTMWQPGKTRRRGNSGPLTCKCNGHSKRCENTETLIGVLCVDCMHNTAGKQCDKCKNEYYKNKDKNIWDADACKECKCATYGSAGRWCQSFGQCKCKANFVGRTCNRCKTGYKFKKNLCVRK